MHYLAMEYVEGSDLATVVKERGPLPVQQAVECILQAARGLQYAHGKGIVHRDIKPGNLLLDNEGTVKILDMGLALIAGAEAALGGAERLTTTGQVMGTCDYMAPEQSLDTHQADARADIYSLGCTLYRLLTGSPPYQGETFAKLFLMHLEAPIPSLCAGPARGARSPGCGLPTHVGEETGGPLPVDGRGDWRTGGRFGRVVRSLDPRRAPRLARIAQRERLREVGLFAGSCATGHADRAEEAHGHGASAAAGRPGTRHGPEGEGKREQLQFSCRPKGSFAPMGPVPCYAPRQGRATVARVGRKPLLLLGIGGGLVVLLLLAVVLNFALRQGTLVVEIDEQLGKDVQVAVSQGGEKVQVADARRAGR